MTDEFKNEPTVVLSVGKEPWYVRMRLCTDGEWPAMRVCVEAQADDGSWWLLDWYAPEGSTVETGWAEDNYGMCGIKLPSSDP